VGDPLRRGILKEKARNLERNSEGGYFKEEIGENRDK